MQVQQDQAGAIVVELNSRLHAIELRYTTLGQHVLSTNQNMVEQYKTVNKEIKMINDDLQELKSELFKLRQTIKKMLDETTIFAKVQDLKVLEKYINLWNPLEFVTTEEVKRIIKEGEQTAKSS